METGEDDIKRENGSLAKYQCVKIQTSFTGRDSSLDNFHIRRLSYNRNKVEIDIHRYLQLQTIY